LFELPQPHQGEGVAHGGTGGEHDQLPAARGGLVLQPDERGHARAVDRLDLAEVEKQVAAGCHRLTPFRVMAGDRGCIEGG